MHWIREEISSGAVTTGIVCTADHQTAGRGRNTGRIWLDDPEEALLCTIAVSASVLEEKHPGMFSLKTGLAIALALETFTDHVQIKWPNDLLLSGRKVAGVLLEKTRKWVLIGFGVNVKQRRFPPEIADRATSLYLSTGSAPERAPLLDRILDSLTTVFDGGNRRDEIERYLSWRGERVRFNTAEFPMDVSGVIDGIEEDGALRVTGLRPLSGRSGASRSFATALPDPWLCYSGEILWNV